MGASRRESLQRGLYSAHKMLVGGQLIPKDGSYGQHWPRVRPGCSGDGDELRPTRVNDVQSPSALVRVPAEVEEPARHHQREQVDTAAFVE